MAKKQKKLEDIVTEIVNAQVSHLRVEIMDELPKVFNSILGNSPFGSAVGVGLNIALDSLVKGKKLDARSIANAMATQLVPTVADAFNTSGSQLGENIFGLISNSQRNM